MTNLPKASDSPTRAEPAEPARRSLAGRLARTVVWALVVLLMAAAGLVWLAGRPETLAWAARHASRLTDGRLSVEGVDGSLLRELTASSVRWQDGQLDVTVERPRIAYQPLALLDGRVVVEFASAARVTVDLPSTDGAPALHLPPAVAAILPLTIHWLELGEVTIRRGGSQPVTLHDIQASMRHDGDRLQVGPLRVDVAAAGKRITVRGDASALAHAPYATDGRFTVQLPSRGEPLRLELRLNGPLRALAVRASTVFAGAPVEARTVLHAFEPRVMRQVRVEMKDLDLSRLDRAMPATRLTGTYEAEVMPAWASEHKPLLVGPLNVANGIAGPLDRDRLPVAVAKAVVGYSDGRVQVQSLQASGPMGDVTGEGWAELDAARGETPRFHLALASDALHLQGIDGKLARRTLKARLTADPPADDEPRPAGGGPSRGTARLQFSASDAALVAEVKAVLAGTRLRIGNAEVAGGRGRARFSGEAGLAAPFPVALAGDFRDFDPRQLLDVPAGRLSGNWRANGNLGDAEERGVLRAEVTLADSRFRDLPLAGEAAATILLDGSVLRRVSDVSARLSWGASTVDASGALGAGDDALRLAISAPRAAEIDDAIEGALEVQATLQGSLLAPAVRAAIDARQLSFVHEGLRADVAAAAIEVSSDHPRSGLGHVKARLDGVDVSRPGAGPATLLLRLDQVTADVAGSRGQHSAELRAKGKDQRLLLAARGGLGSDGEWRGRVEELEASHPLLRMPQAGPRAPSAVPDDGGALESLQPFTLEAGPDRILLRDARFLFHGARVAVRTADWKGSSLALRADASGVPARWLARFIDLDALYGKGGVPAGKPVATAPQPLRVAAAVDFRGDLGDETAADWKGTLRLSRESGDASLPAPDGGAPIAAGLHTLEASATIDARVVKVVLDVAGDGIGHIGMEAQATARPGDDPVWSRAALARSPLEGRLDVATNSLRWISPLAGDSWRIDGGLSARLRLAGTVGRPHADGVVTGSGLTAYEPAMGVRLVNGVLAAQFSGERVDVKVLRFESGEGSVAVSGLLQAPANGRSEARVVVDRLPVPLGPKQRAVLSGSTVAALREGALSVTGRLVAEEGVVDLGRGTLPPPSGGVELVDREGGNLAGRDAVPTPRGIDRQAVRKTGAAPADALPGSRPFRIDTDVELDFGRHFRVVGDGLEARLQGAIRVHGNPLQAPRATGTVQLVDGVYRIQDRRLTVRHGRVVFDGPLENPALDIVAVRENLKVKPGLAITGSASEPVVKLVAEPGLADAARLPRLVLGAGSEDAQGAQRTASALGTRLGARLIDTYEQSLRGVWNILRLQYEITDRLSLGVQAGRERAADLLGFFPFD